jgi:DNA-binding transcriptional ArsR family regulator
VPADPGLGTLDGVLDGVLDELVEDDEVAAVRVEVLGLAPPPVDASATPATLPPSPAAMTAVRMSRLMRPEVLHTIRGFSFPCWVLRTDPAQALEWPALSADKGALRGPDRAQFVLCGLSEIGPSPLRSSVDNLRKISTVSRLRLMTESRRVTDPDALKALTHPLRRQILRLLTQIGPATVTTLGEHTGADPGQLSFHLRELAKRGFIIEAPELARDRRERWWRVPSGSVSWSTEDFSDPDGRAIADTVQRMTVTEEIERLTTYESVRQSFGTDWVDAATSTQYNLRLRPDELRDLTADLNEVMLRWTAVGRQDPAVRPQDWPDDGREHVFLFLHAFPEKP